MLMCSCRALWLALHVFLARRLRTNARIPYFTAWLVSTARIWKTLIRVVNCSLYLYACQTQGFWHRRPWTEVEIMLDVIHEDRMDNHKGISVMLNVLQWALGGVSKGTWGNTSPTVALYLKDMPYTRLLIFPARRIGHRGYLQGAGVSSPTVQTPSSTDVRNFIIFASTVQIYFNHLLIGA